MIDNGETTEGLRNGMKPMCYQTPQMVQERRFLKKNVLKRLFLVQFKLSYKYAKVNQRSK